MSVTSFNLKNKNIIITGGFGFLGTQITNSLLKEKANVYIIDIKKPKKESKTKYFETDITKENELKKILNFFRSKNKKIDVLINNAAIDYNPTKKGSDKLKLESFSNDIWDKDILVSLKGSYLCTKIFGSYMSKFKKGSIINISSDLGIIAPDQRIYNKNNFTKPVTYSVVKHGILGLTRYTATYWADKKVRCNAIAPGGIKNNQPKNFLNKVSKLIPMSRLSNQNEYMSSILYLITDASSYTNGAILNVDGGRTVL